MMWELYDDRLQFMARSDAFLLDESLRLDDVCIAWMVWSEAAEAALDDANQFAAGPVLVWSLVLERGRARFRVVRLGRPKVRNARSGSSDVHEAGDVFMYRDSSGAPLLDGGGGSALSVDLTVHVGKNSSDWACLSRHS